MVWFKTYTGLKAWCIKDFNRKSVERYFTHTFVFHVYNIITNSIMFLCQSDFYGEWIIPNIILTVFIGGAFVFILYKHLKHKDREQTKHIQLWCGDIVDSSDEEEAYMNTSPKKEFYRCTQESDACIIYFHNPNRRKNFFQRLIDRKDTNRENKPIFSQ